MRTWFEPAPALREFVRGYVYEHPGETFRRPILPVLETRLAFFPGAACRVFDHRLQAIDVLAHAVVIGPQTRRCACPYAALGFRPSVAWPMNS